MWKSIKLRTISRKDKSTYHRTITS